LVRLVIAEVIPGLYPLDGSRISQPHKTRHRCFNGRPMGLFLSQPLKIVCRDMDEIRAFLRTCRYVSDQEQFGQRDHWMGPEEFEVVRKGDCDDFALWTWRQLIDLGYNARYVYGLVGAVGNGHAWVTYEVEGRTYVVEPLAARFGPTFARLAVLRYRPILSVDISDGRVRYFEHAQGELNPPFWVVAPLIAEWLRFRARILGRWARWPFLMLWWWLRRRKVRVNAA
jgi:hypothetical protein